MEQKDRIDSMRASGLSWDEIGKELRVGWRLLMWHYAPERAAYHAERHRKAAERQRRVMGVTEGRPSSYAKRGRDGAWVNVDVLGELPPPDTRDLTARIFGDPIFERSALYKIRIGGDVR